MYNSFEPAKHLKPDFIKDAFESLQLWDFGWELLEPLNIATDQENSEIELSRRLSPGQKALYFFWYLDAQVTNGGFIQFLLEWLPEISSPNSSGASTNRRR